MSNILTQAEIDELVKAVASGEKTLEDFRTEQLMPQPRKYDFRRPNKFSKTQINALNMIHQNFGRVLSSYLSAFLRSTVDIKVASVEQLTFGDYNVSIDTTLAIIFDVNELGSAIIELGLPVVFPMIELMLGGNGHSKAVYRPLTDLEMSVMQKVADRILERYSLVWNEAAEVTLTKQSLEPNLRLIYTIPPNEIVILITFTAQINDVSGLMNICLPFSALEPLLGKLTSHHRITNVHGSCCLKDYPDQFYQCPLRLTAVAGKVPLTVKDLMELEPGDIVLTNKDVAKDFELLVEGKPMYSVLAGISNGKKAVQITSMTEVARDGE